MNNTTATQHAPEKAVQPEHKPEHKPKRKTGASKWVVGTVICAAGVWMWHSHQSKAADETENAGTATSGTPIVAVSAASKQDLSDSMALSAEFRPYQAISVHAKVAGYVQSISVDIGDHVKEGQSLAILEIPELKEDVQRAEAAFDASKQDVKKAQATYENAHFIYTRLQEVAKANPKLVALQDLETSKSKDASTQSALAAARAHVAECQAEVEKVHTLLDYATITAPFTGVITKRYADTGALIQAGTASNTQAMPLVDLAEDDRLRLDFPVPESVVSKVHDGSEVEITVDSLGETFKGAITRYSGKVDTSTRTMNAEVDIDNKDGKFTPGMYASIRLVLDSRKQALSIPVQAIISGKTPKVMVVNAAQEIEERPVTLGMQTPDEAQVLSGLKEGDLVVVGNRTSLHVGEKVIGKMTDLAAN